MSSPSRVVARGTIRVDARKAIEQLRNHLLIDLHHYALEIVRFAVAGQARRLDFRRTRDTLSAEWDGEPLRPEVLGSLLDYVLSQSDSAEAKRARLLALAVNAALGLRPSLLEITTNLGDHCVRVRWTADTLRQGATPEIANVPSKGSWPSMRLEVLREFRLRSLLGAGLGEVPQELEVLRGSTYLLPDLLTLEGTSFPRLPRAQALVRKTFSLSGTRYAAVEITATPAPEPAVEVNELGVLLCTQRWQPTAPFPAAAFLGCSLPVRVVLDAVELETNASRSALRETTALLRDLGPASHAAFLSAVGTLAARVSQGPAPKDPAEVLCEDNVRLEDALASIAVVVAGAARQGCLVPESDELLQLPLLRDALGNRCSLRPYAIAPPSRVWVWQGQEALPSSLEHWLQGVLWLRNSIPERLLTGAEIVDAGPLVQRAKLAQERRMRFLATPPATSLLQPPSSLAHEKFCEEQEPWIGLRGEVAVLDPEKSDGSTRVHVYLEERHFQSFSLSPEVCPLTLEVGVEWPGRVRAVFDYDAVENNDALKGALWKALLAGVRVVDSFASRLDQLQGVEAQRLERLLRAALGTLGGCARRLGLEERVQEPTVSDYQGLARARVWPITSGDQVSYAELLTYVERTRALCYAPAGTLGVALDRRPVLACSAQETAWLAAALGPGITLVPYSKALRTGAVVTDRTTVQLAALDQIVDRSAPGSIAAVSLTCSSSTMVARILTSTRSEMVVLHAGQQLLRAGRTPIAGPVFLAIDDDTAVPTEDWGSLLYFEPGLAERLEVWFATALVSALEGNPVQGAAIEGVPANLGDAHPELVAWLLKALYELKGSLSSELRQLFQRLEALPFLLMLDASGAALPASVGTVRARHPAGTPVPVVAYAPGFETYDWLPVVLADSRCRELLGRLLEDGLLDATAEIPHRRLRAEEEQLWASKLSEECLDPSVVEGVAEASLPVVFHALESAWEGESATAAAGVAERGPTRIRVLFRRRFLEELLWSDWPIPLAVTVNLVERAHAASPRRVSVKGAEFLFAAAVRCRGLLAIALVSRASGEGRQQLLFGDPRALAIVQATVLIPIAEDADLLFQLQNALRDSALLWPTVQGGAEPLERLRTSDAGVWIGRRQFVPWRKSPDLVSEYDAPVAYVPSGAVGDPVEVLLKWLSGPVHDVTEQIARLQLQRSGAPQERPRLSLSSGPPGLRKSFSELGIRSAQGEMELIDGEESDLVLVGLEGIPTPIVAKLPIPVRALARTEFSLSEEGKRYLLSDITRGAAALLRSVAGNAENPEFVRARLRRLVCVALARGNKDKAKRDLLMPVFADVQGRWHSAQDLSTSKEPLTYTTDPPPYYAGRQERVVLRLTEEEAKALSTLVVLGNATEHQRRLRDGEARRAAKPLAQVRLDPALRIRCLRIATLSGPGLEGELGWLAPEFAADRGLRVYVQKRYLCTLPDGPGWPLVAALGEDSLQPNSIFDDLLSADARSEVRDRIRRLAAAEFAQDPRIQTPVVAYRIIDQTVQNPKLGLTLTVHGTIWFPPSWPRNPSMIVRSSLHFVPRRLPLRAPPLTPQFDSTLPVCGDLSVLHADESKKQYTDDKLQEIEGTLLSSIALSHLGSLLEEALPRLAPDEVEAWKWNLAFLGVVEAPGCESPYAPGHLRAPCLEGSRSVSDLLDALASGEPLVIAKADLRGSAEATEAILLDDGGACVRVLRARAQGALREKTVPLAPLFEPYYDHESPETSWLQRLVDGVSEMFTSEESQAALDPVLVEGIRKSLLGLRLSGNPVRSLRLVSRGRPLRYRPKQGALLINASHRSVRLCLKRPREAAIAWLVAAALTEINRELAGVTDAEEREALELLLTQLPREQPSTALKLGRPPEAGE